MKFTAASRGPPCDSTAFLFHTVLYNFEVLLNAGATLTADEDGWTPLHAAAGSTTSDCGVVRLLVDAVVRSGDISQLGAKTKDGKNTALHLAASNEKALFPARCGP